MTHMKELLGLTGYIRGGCSPIGMKKKYPTFIDETCILFDEIAVSAGVRGEQVILNPQDLVQYIEATEADHKADGIKQKKRNKKIRRNKKTATSEKPEIAVFCYCFSVIL